MKLNESILHNLKEGSPVTVICGGTKFEFDSLDKAKSFWLNCYYNSEGSEQSRYEDILMDLNDGETFVTDGSTPKSGVDLYNKYKGVKDSGKYKVMDREYTLGGDSWKTAEDYITFFNGSDLARSKSTWKEFRDEMAKGGYDKESKYLQNKLEKDFGVKLEGATPRNSSVAMIKGRM